MSILTDHPDRIKTAVVLLLVVAVVGIIDSHFVTWAFLGMVYGFALSEVLPMFKISDVVVPYAFGGAVWIVTWFYPHPSDLIVLGLLVFAGVLAYKRTIEPLSYLPLLYPTIGMIFIWMLYLEYGMVSLLWMLLVVALTDIGAYYTGRTIGKTPFSPTSPNKTLEGVVGGVILGAVSGTFIATGWMEIGLFTALIISLIGSKFSIFGDLFESYLKREAGVKDSGTVLPGHGGVLDRIDGYLFAAPSMYILLILLGS